SYATPVAQRGLADVHCLGAGASAISERASGRDGVSLPDREMAVPEIIQAVYKEGVMQKIMAVTVILFLVVGLSGCSDMSQTGKSTLVGGAGGAAGGALIGAMAGNAGMGAAIGAGVGVAGGFLYGKSKEAQQNAYQQGYQAGQQSR